MTVGNDRNRVKRGVPTGGQFALERKRAGVTYASSVSSSELEEWAKAGFTEIAATRWINAGIPLKAATLWRNQGVSLAEAVVLRDIEPNTALLWLGDGFTAEETVIFSQFGLSLHIAHMWRDKAGFSADDDVATWIECGVSPTEAKRLRGIIKNPETLKGWLASGYPLELAVKKCKKDIAVESELELWERLKLTEVDRFFFMQLDVYDPEEAYEWKKLKSGERIAAWLAPLGVQPEEIKPWQDCGVQERNWLVWMEHDISPEDAHEWERLELTPRDYATWVADYDNPEDVFSCKKLGIVWPEDAKALIPRKTTPVEALIWKQHGIELNEINDWLEEGFEAQEADMWKGAGYDPDAAKSLIADGYIDPQYAERALEDNE
jgi:hypothetical protein